MVTPEEAKKYADILQEIGRNESAQALRDLVAQVEALQADADRYRWLRRKVCVIQSWNFSGEKISAAEFEFVNLPRLSEVPKLADQALDAAIDAARKDQP